eukprot:COSAG04_NODE_1592_length_6214_cov_4.841047_4_plen_180_part_00
MSGKATELAQAAWKNDLQTMERLIAEGVSADAKNEYGDPALALAAGGGHLDALKLLRRHGAKVDATDTNGRTALTWAARTGKADCAEALLEWGADKDAADKYGGTALHFAALEGHLDRAGARPRAMRRWLRGAHVLSSSTSWTDSPQFLARQGALCVPRRGQARVLYPRASGGLRLRRA